MPVHSKVVHVADLAMQLLHQDLALLADTSRGLAVGYAALDALALSIAQLGGLRVTLVCHWPPQPPGLLLLHRTGCSFQLNA